MKALKNCIECGDEIEFPRVGKQFCSPACKQRNYAGRKKGAPTSEIQNQELIPIPKRKFDVAEYRRLGKRFELDEYFFLRKDLLEDAKDSTIISHMSKYETYLFVDSSRYDEEKIAHKRGFLKAYEKFVEDFHSGVYELFDSEEEKVDQEMA